MIDKSRWLKIIGISLVLGVLVGGGLTLSRYVFAPTAEKLVTAGEASYAKGEEALKSGDAAAAAARFDEANLQANKALQAIAKEREKAKSDGNIRAHLTQLEGRGLWLKARALRDEYFAKAVVEGHPLPDTTDPLGGDKFRCVLHIPDGQARGEALMCLRLACPRMADNDKLLRQTLLTETIMPVMDWSAIEKLARLTLKHNPNDPWALYLLARYEYDQPSADGRPTAASKMKRSRERIQQARQYVQQLKNTNNYPLWRTLFLEAEIAQWLRDDAGAASGTRRDIEESTLRSLLFGPKGALARAATGEGLEHPSKWDAEGILGLHEIALNMAVEDSRQPKATTKQVVELLDATLKLCQQLADKDTTRIADCALSAIAALSKAQPVLVSEPPPNWNDDLEVAQELARKAREQKVSNPSLYESLAGLLAREAIVEGKRGHKERRDALNAQALQWVEEGLRLGAEAKLSPGALGLLNAVAAEMKTLAGGKAEQIAPYLTALKEARTPRARTLVSLLEAAAAERDGRLADARKLLEKVLASDDNDLILKAHMLLGGIYLATGQPDKALVSLQQVQKAYTVFDKLTPQEKAWALEFVQTPADLAVLMVQANADSALNKLREQARRNPDKPVSLDAVRYHEKAIDELLKSLQKETPQDRRARQMLALYYAATKRPDLAEKELTELHTYYPNSAEVLRTEVNVLEMSRDADGKPSAAAIEETDRRLEQFIEQHPSDLDARFFRVEWLIRQKRYDAALAYLRSPSNFTDTKSERYRRVLATALLTKGDRQGSQKVLEHLPHDSATDALLIEAAATADREKLVQQAIARHENSALIQIWRAVLAYNKRDYETAAEAFLNASRYTRFEETAKGGLLPSLLQLAQTDPAKARNLAARMHKESPDEPVLLLACAYAALQLDAIGTPNDTPDAVKSMASALNSWEHLILEQKPQDKASAPLTKAEFWALAGRQDFALTEAVRSINVDPKNPAALRLAVALALELRDPDLRAVTRKRLDALKQLQPDNADNRLLEARYDEDTEQPKDARTIYEDLLKKDPKLTAAYLRLIPLLAKQGDKDRARDYVKQWRKELPENVAAAQMDVRLLAENKEAGQARKVADAFVEEQPARERKQIEDAKPGTQKSLEATRLNLQLQMIAGLMQGKAWSEAESWLTQLSTQYPDNATIPLLLGDGYVAQSVWDKARTFYEKALALDAKQAAAGNNLAWLLAKHFNDAPKALGIVEELRKGQFSHKPLSGDRLRTEFLDTLGVVYTKANQASAYGAMRDLFEAARPRYPHDPRISMYLGHAYAGLMEAERAERLYALALDIAHKSGQQFLTPDQCKEVIAEVEAAQKKLKETAQR